MKIRKILSMAVKEVSEEFGIPEEDVWKATIKIKEKAKI